MFPGFAFAASCLLRVLLRGMFRSIVHLAGLHEFVCGLVVMLCRFAVALTLILALVVATGCLFVGSFAMIDSSSGLGFQCA